jgi:hypothetical protein
MNVKVGSTSLVAGIIPEFAVRDAKEGRKEGSKKVSKKVCNEGRN